MFIDIHVHTVSNCDLAVAPGYPPVSGPEKLIEMFDAVGIDKAVVQPLTTPENAMVVQSNEEVLAIADKYPDRFIPFCNIDPRLHKNSADTDLSYVIDYYKDKGCKGIGELTFNLYFDDPRVHNLFHHADKCQMPVCLHFATKERDTYGLIDDFGLPRFEDAVQRFPEITWLCHSESWWAFISGDVTADEWDGYPTRPVAQGGRCIEMMRKYPNIYGDLSARSGYNAVSRDPEFGYWFLNEFQDQLCFATDVWTITQMDNRLIWLAEFLKDALAGDKISQEVFDKIAYKNAHRVLAL